MADSGERPTVVQFTGIKDEGTNKGQPPKEAEIKNWSESSFPAAPDPVEVAQKKMDSMQIKQSPPAGQTSESTPGPSQGVMYTSSVGAIGFSQSAKFHPGSFQKFQNASHPGGYRGGDRGAREGRKQHREPYTGRPPNNYRGRGRGSGVFSPDHGYPHTPKDMTHSAAPAQNQPAGEMQQTRQVPEFPKHDPREFIDHRQKGVRRFRTRFSARGDGKWIGPVQKYANRYRFRLDNYYMGTPHYFGQRKFTKQYMVTSNREGEDKPRKPVVEDRRARDDFLMHMTQPDNYPSLTIGLNGISHCRSSDPFTQGAGFRISDYRYMKALGQRMTDHNCSFEEAKEAITCEPFMTEGCCMKGTMCPQHHDVRGLAVTAGVAPPILIGIDALLGRSREIVILLQHIIDQLRDPNARELRATSIASSVTSTSQPVDNLRTKLSELGVYAVVEKAKKSKQPTIESIVAIMEKGLQSSGDKVSSICTLFETTTAMLSVEERTMVTNTLTSFLACLDLDTEREDQPEVMEEGKNQNEADAES